MISTNDVKPGMTLDLDDGLAYDKDPLGRDELDDA